MKTDEDITGLLALAREGDGAARDRVVAALHRELGGIARAKLQAESTITHLDAAALVNECWIRLAQGAPGRWENRRAFLAYAASAMRSVIVDVAREHRALKRGGGLREITLTTGVALEVFADRELEALAAALEALAKLDRGLLEIVELRYFAGLTVEEVAGQLGLSPKTVKRRWQLARAFLFREIRGEAPG